MKSIKVKIKDGQILPYAKKYFDNLLKNLDGKEMMLSLDKPKSIRSVEANRYYWLLIDHISEYTGEDKNALHEYFKQKYLSEEILVMGCPVQKRTSTTKLSVRRFYEYCEKIRAEMSEFGFELPSKDDWEKQIA